MLFSSIYAEESTLLEDTDSTVYVYRIETVVLVYFFFFKG